MTTAYDMKLTKNVWYCHSQWFKWWLFQYGFTMCLFNGTVSSKVVRIDGQELKIKIRC